MNGILKIAVIFGLILSLNCLSVQAQTTNTPDEKTEIIHLNIDKTEQFKTDVKTSLTEKETDEDIKKTRLAITLIPSSLFLMKF